MSDLDRITAFLTGIGIGVRAEHGSISDTFLPGVVIRDGGLIYDPDRLAWPGDLLHEGGHIAVTAPDARATLSTVADDPAEEMAAIAWSYAAARAIGLDAGIVFHAGGYGKGGAWLATAFAGGGCGPGTPMLGYWGMTREPGGPARDAPDFPAMARWLR